MKKVITLEQIRKFLEYEYEDSTENELREMLIDVQIDHNYNGMIKWFNQYQNESNLVDF